MRGPNQNYIYNNMSIESLKAHLRTIPDFPKPGIMFCDITTLLKDPDCLVETADRIYEMYKDKGITKVVGLESRGFMLGGLLAARLGAGFVPERKPGKLPADTVSVRYEKEYGFDVLEIHKDAITEDDVVLIHDDLLATGGTVCAAIDLVRRFNPKAVYANFIIELTDLPGRSVIPSDVPVEALIRI